MPAEERDEVEGDVIGDADEQAIVRAQSQAMTDAHIEAAKKYPRSVTKFKREAHELATMDIETACQCFYSLPRAGKKIEGASARLAEILMSSWGNCAGGARIISEGEKFITAQGIFQDFERNIQVSYEVRRRITDKHGKRYKDDMIVVTANAACSIALRNSVLKGIPKAFWQPIYESARQTAIGDAKTMSAVRFEMVEYFSKMGVTEAQICRVLEVAGLDDIGEEELLTLRGLATAIRDGDTSIDETFGDESKLPPTGRRKIDFGNEPKKTEPASEEEPAPKKKRRKKAAEPEPEAQQEPEAEPEPEGGDESEETTATVMLGDERYNELVDIACENLRMEGAEAELKVAAWMDNRKYTKKTLEDDKRWALVKQVIEGWKVEE